MSDQVTDAELNEIEALAARATNFDMRALRDAAAAKRRHAKRYFDAESTEGANDRADAFEAGATAIESLPRLVKALREARALLADAWADLLRSAVVDGRDTDKFRAIRRRWVELDNAADSLAEVRDA